jgi:hypothetical protein
MTPLPLPEPLATCIATFTAFLDARQADLMRPLFQGILFAHGRRTATSWFRAGDCADDFRRAYHLLGTLGRCHIDTCSSLLLGRLRRDLAPQPPDHWLFSLDDSPTQRYGPHVEGAGIHHNPTPGPTHQRHLYGHVWVTLGWVVRHPTCHTLCLPLCAELYIREKDIAQMDPDRRPPFQTKLELAGARIDWLAERFEDSPVPVWVVHDGGYTKRPVFKAAAAARRTHHVAVVLVGRLRRDAALWSLPPVVLPGQKRGRGQPRKYGSERLHLAKRAAHPQGWQEVECFQYQKTVRKTVKTFLATYKPAGGLIRVVIVKEKGGWLAYYCQDVTASLKDILEAVAGRTSQEQMHADVKEVEGAGQQQLRYWLANVGAYNACLWAYTLVEWWAWDKAAAELCDRSDSPWDTTARRVSHAEKRKALQQHCLREEFWRCWGDRPRSPEIEEAVELLLDMAG